MRTRDELRQIAGEFVLRASSRPGLGMFLIVFDAKGPSDRHITMALHGISEHEAVRMLREQADNLQKIAKEKEEAQDSMIIKPHNFS
jgi:hypothetical protein